MTDSQELRLADLRRRLETDSGSRLFVQLAEEYRRMGRLDEALGVLEKGLQEHPGYVSAQVALARVRLDRGEAPAASTVLEGVVARDPTHLVAAKLLVEARLQCGDPAGAKSRLDLYRLLNDGDPESDELAQRIAAAAGAAPEPEASGAGSAIPDGGAIAVPDAAPEPPAASEPRAWL